ncbi:hypothetical protein P152DRAFT_447291 [Eremomyces bilateralis CBS 781.70]|uniref:Uncharacterized protein n=1 Tax=Eremomyces bilateralis CBS 781.70 TaxID=1392243 RepID=A0A6G1GAI6_9PEZI|nr:uncharacterized protein P152DRAFT_447291 [Eremomyces bilateralis CBS 781.70]KAF1815022.1 hypothetical protein P152DRAFT_447291 [Eremomyces bilateralis CBS 781.70]
MADLRQTYTNVVAAEGAKYQWALPVFRFAAMVDEAGSSCGREGGGPGGGGWGGARVGASLWGCGGGDGGVGGGSDGQGGGRKGAPTWPFALGSNERGKIPLK